VRTREEEEEEEEEEEDAFQHTQRKTGR